MLHKLNNKLLQEINNILDELDPNGYGTLSFKEFCSGVRAIRRRQKFQERKYALRKFKGKKTEAIIIR